jgi:hypothetical protein
LVEISSRTGASALHARLTRELDAYAADVAGAIHLVRAGAWRRGDLAGGEPAARSGFARDVAAIVGTTRAFRRAGFALASRARGD